MLRAKGWWPPRPFPPAYPFRGTQLGTQPPRGCSLAGCNALGARALASVARRTPKCKISPLHMLPGVMKAPPP